jgi:hypothetical protein
MPDRDARATPRWLMLIARPPGAFSLEAVDTAREIPARHRSFYKTNRSASSCGLEGRIVGRIDLLRTRLWCRTRHRTRGAGRPEGLG